MDYVNHIIQNRKTITEGMIEWGKSKNCIGWDDCLIHCSCRRGTALASSVHVVSPGDTYWKISQWYGVDLTALMNANGANGNSVLYVGQRVTIPTKMQGT